MHLMQADRLPRGSHEEATCDRRDVWTHTRRNVVDGFGERYCGKHNTPRRGRMLVGRVGEMKKAMREGRTKVG